MSSAVFVVVFAGCLLLGARDAAAQISVDSVKPGAVVRISTPAGRISGRFASATDSTLVLNLEGTRRWFDLSAVDSLWVFRSRSAHSTRTGALVGGGIGAAILGIFVRGLCDVPECTTPTLQAGAIGGFLGGIFGAFFGSLAGNARGEWRLLMPHRN